jgi:hypothetical protein
MRWKRFDGRFVIPLRLSRFDLDHLYSCTHMTDEYSATAFDYDDPRGSCDPVVRD